MGALPWGDPSSVFAMKRQVPMQRGRKTDFLGGIAFVVNSRCTLRSALKFAATDICASSGLGCFGSAAAAPRAHCGSTCKAFIGAGVLLGWAQNG